MRKTHFFLTLFILLISSILLSGNHSVPDNKLNTIDYQMAERTLDWLDFIKTGADTAAVKDYFMKQVAPTGVCQAIIHHWAFAGRFFARYLL